MHGLTGGDWKRDRYLRKPRQSPTLPICRVTWAVTVGTRWSVCGPVCSEGSALACLTVAGCLG